MEKLAENISYERAVFEIDGFQEAAVSAVVNFRPVRLTLTPGEGGKSVCLTVRTDDPVPFMLHIKKPSGFTEKGFQLELNGRKNAGFSLEEDFVSIDRVWAGKTVLELFFYRNR